jgi:hypothetical protein
MAEETASAETQEAVQELTPQQIEENTILGIATTPPTAKPEEQAASSTEQSATAAEVAKPSEEKVIDFDAPIPLGGEHIKQEEPKAIAPEAEQALVERYSGLNIKTVSELDDRISNYEAVNRENLELKARLEEATKNANPFKTDAEKKLFEFAKGYDGKNASALAEYARLQEIDPETMTDKEVMLEAFVIENKKMGRSEASRLFEIRYKNQYSTDKLDPEDPSEAEMIEERKMEAKYAALQAKEKLAKTKADYKPIIAEETQSQVQENKLLVESAQRKTAQVEGFAKSLAVLKVPTGDKEGQSFNVSLNDVQKSQVAEALSGWTKNHGSYNPDGTFNGPADATEMAEMVIYGMYGKDLVKAAFNKGIQYKELQYVEQNKVQKSQGAIGADKPIASDGLSSSQLEEMAIIGAK